MNSSLNLLLKLFALGNAGKNIAAPFIIAAHNKMGPDDFYLAQVPGLHNSSDTNASDGYVAICLTKCGTAGLWKAFFLKFCIPEMVRATSHLQCKHIDGSPMRLFLKTDGEACILDTAQDEEVMACFKENSIDYLKSGPGVTPWDQEWDTGTMFLDVDTSHVSATSVIVEQLFSRCGIIMRPHRRLMDPYTLELLVTGNATFQ